MSPRVRLQPIGEELECGSDETLLDAAFRSGYNLVYGCREGQCSACKCFLIEGEVALKPYSSFALSDSEQAGGYTLMCRAMPEQDLVVELLHYDPDAYRLEHPIRDGSAVVEAVEPLTHDISRLLLRVEQPVDFSFVPGQYVDLHVPGDSNGARRSFSLANLPGDGSLELIIKRYPGGRISGMLGSEINQGVRIGFTGPYGSFRLRSGDAPILMLAGGAGLAPILSVLRQLAAERCERPVRFFYGARAERDLFDLTEISTLGSRLTDFRFTRVLSDTEGFLHDAVGEYLSGGEISAPDVYMCGPPAMLEAAEQMLVGEHRLDAQRIFQDKFTTSANAGPGITSQAAVPADAAAPPVKRVGSAPGSGLEDSERQFQWFEPRKRRATLYEDVTVDTQPSIHRHLTRGWPVSFEDGRGTWSDSSTALRSTDWFAFRDPGEQWERPFYQAGAAAERQIEGALNSAAREGLLADVAPAWVEFLRSFLQVPAFVEHGLWFATATAARDCLSDSICQCVCLQAAMKQRSAQAKVLYAMDLEQHFGDFAIDAARGSFLNDPAWQPTRRYLERLAHVADWGEVIVGANLCFEPLVGTLLRREIGTRVAAANGDTVTPVLARAETQEWEWTRAWSTELAKFVLDDAQHGTVNRQVLAGWVRDWLPQALEAALALAPLAARVPGGIEIGRTAARLRAYAGGLLAEAGLGELCDVLEWEPAASDATATSDATAAPPRRRSQGREQAERTVAVRPKPLPPPAPTHGDGAGAYDYVGIVMARSAEGDAVAEVLARREEIEVIEQPAFWDIRAKHRLVIPYEEVCEQLGYEIDAYSIQHEMSTHYGRMVATDDALMLFSDPVEAMEYLMT